MRVLRKMPNWKPPSPISVQGYLLKNLTPTHDRLLVYLQDYLNSEVVRDWFTKERTVLMQKDKTMGNIARNYRPITWLPLGWTLLTGILAEMLSPEKQKGSKPKCNGTGDVLFIEKTILREV